MAKTKHIASCSFGKDSLATVVLALEHGEPLDEVVYCEVMFDSSTSGEVPEHRDFIYEKAIPELKSWGIHTIVLRSKNTYMTKFLHVIKKGPKCGCISAFPLCGKCSIQRDCKLQPIKKYQRGLAPDTVQYIGIAKDEQDRLLRLNGTKISLLDKYGVDEAGAFEICKKTGLLSPIYKFAPRNGCFFCPNAKEAELRHLYDYHKPLWNRLLELQNFPNKATDRFNREMTFAEIDHNFRFDDTQIIWEDLGL